MRKYELSIDVNYVKDWGVSEAIRELFQNSVDEEQVNPSNKSFFGYNEEKQELTIGNKCSCLDIESLLLGVTSKTNDDDTVGQFGEGYKIATVVLLRTKHPITFYNYGKREVWRPRLVKSRRYNGRLIPTFFVDKEFPWTSVPDNDLTIVVENITPEEYEQITHMILQLSDDIGDIYEVHTGNQVLLNPKYTGRIYVNGLYVCTDKTLNYGYNIQPRDLRLERDRKTVDGFDLIWTTSSIWGYLMDKKEFREMLFSDNTTDISYVVSMRNPTPSSKKWFTDTYGVDAIPCSTQSEYDDIVARGGRPVVVSNMLSKFYSHLYNTFTANNTLKGSTRELFEQWFGRLKSVVNVPIDLSNEFEELLNELDK